MTPLALVVSVFTTGVNGLNNREPLHAAAWRGNVIQAYFAILRCPDAVNTPARFTKLRSPTPVHLAAASDSVGVLELLLAHGGKVNDPGESGATPLQHAARWGSINTAELLLKHGATLDIFSAVALNKWKEVQTCFRVASYFGWEKRLANVRSDGPGWESTPLLLWAIESGHLRMVEILIHHGAEVNPEANSKRTLNWPPLHAAVYARRFDIARFLIQHGAKIDAQDFNGYTALHHAVSARDVEMTRLLLKHGASLDTRTDFHAPRASDTNGDPSTFNTPLHLAVEREQPEIAALLLAHGACPNACNIFSQTPADVAFGQRCSRGLCERTFVLKPADQDWKLSPARIQCLKLLYRYGGTHNPSDESSD